MKKIYLFLLLTLIIVAAYAIASVFSGEKTYPEEEFSSPMIKQRTEKGIVKTGYGWSEKDNAKQAVAEAVSKMNQGLKGNSPDYLVLFSTVGYDSTEILEETRELVGPKPQIYGGTSCLAVITKDGWHQGTTGSLAVLGISSKKIKFGVGGADLDKFNNAQEAGKQAALEAIGQAGKTRKDSPKLVMMTTAPGYEEEIISGIETIIGKNVPIIGGSSGDNDITGKWKEFANNKVYSNGISVSVIYTDLKLSFAFESGFLKTEKRGIITKAEGRTIYEIDNQPAAEVYNNWTNGEVAEELKKGGTILGKTAFYPLAKILKGVDGEIHYLSIHPLSINLPEKSLTVFTNVGKGEEILFMKGNWEILLNRARTTPLKSLIKENIRPEEVAFGIYRFCAGTMLAIPEQERVKMPLLVNQVLEGAPFIGAFTFGEQGYLAGVGNKHGNLVNSMIVFTEEEQE